MNDILLGIVNKLSEYFMSTPHPSSDYYNNWNYVPSNFNKILHTLKDFNFNELPKNPKILEIGCGIGIISYMLNKTFENSIVDGIDINKDLIDVANISFGSNNINFSVNDITKFTKEQIQQYDLIFIYRIYVNDPDEKKFEMNLLKNMKNKSYLYSYDSVINKLPIGYDFVYDDIIIKNYINNYE